MSIRRQYQRFARAFTARPWRLPARTRGADAASPVVPAGLSRLRIFSPGVDPRAVRRLRRTMPHTTRPACIDRLSARRYTWGRSGSKGSCRRRDRTRRPSPAADRSSRAVRGWGRRSTGRRSPTVRGCPMVRYLLMRLLGILGVFFVISLLTFALMHAIPGGPFDEEKMPLPPVVKQNILRTFGLDKPLWQQYLLYLWNALHLDFGVSYQRPGETVIQLIARVWPVSMHLGGMALAVAFSLGLSLGTVAALHQNTWVDYLVTLFATAGLIIPHFVLAVLLILLFSNTLHLLPTGGWSGPENW